MNNTLNSVSNKAEQCSDASFCIRKNQFERDVENYLVLATTLKFNLAALCLSQIVIENFTEFFYYYYFVNDKYNLKGLALKAIGYAGKNIV